MPAPKKNNPKSTFLSHFVYRREIYFPIKLSRYFFVHDFLPPNYTLLFKERAFVLVCPVLIRLLDELVDYFGGKEIKINTWYYDSEGNVSGRIKGTRYRGWRPPNANTGLMWSPHRYGRAADIMVEGVPPQQVQEALRADATYWFKKGLTVIEEGTTLWTHISTEYTGRDELLIKPFKYYEHEVGSPFWAEWQGVKIPGTGN